MKNYLLCCAGLFTFGGLGILLATGRRKETETGRVAAAFAIASAATVLLAMVSPHGSEMIEQLLRGEILTADLHEFETIAVVYGLILLAIVVFHRDLLLTSFDRDLAQVEGKRVRRVEALLLSLTGLAVSVGVLIVGPVVLFGLLVIPPLAARCLDEGAVVLGHKGRPFTKENVGESLATRQLLKQLREQGVMGGGPPPHPQITSSGQ